MKITANNFIQIKITEDIKVVKEIKKSKKELKEGKGNLLISLLKLR